MSDVRAPTPFRFVGCVELREMLGRKAADVQQLMSGIEEIPVDSIYYHTHSYFLRYEHGPSLFRAILRRGWPCPFETVSSANGWA